MNEGKQGSVFVTIQIRADGIVSEAKIKQGLSPKLDAAALKAAKQWRFKPATKDGKPVAVEKQLERPSRPSLSREPWAVSVAPGRE